MKTFKTKLLSAFMIVSFGLTVLEYSGCSSNNENDPCGNLECLNGGEKIAGIDDCHCDCPAGYTGTNCETKVTTTCVDTACPTGTSPNPDHGCACE